MAEQETSLEQRLRELQAHVDEVRHAQQDRDRTLENQAGPADTAGEAPEATGETSSESQAESNAAPQTGARREEVENERQLEELRKERAELEQRLREVRAGAAGSNSAS